MLRTLTWTVALCLLASCGGDDASAKGGYAEQCSNSGDCEGGLECLNRLCTLRCTDTTQCRAYSDQAACVTGICYNTCVSTFNCPPGLQCTMSISGQTCQVQ